MAVGGLFCQHATAPFSEQHSGLLVVSSAAPNDVFAIVTPAHTGRRPIRWPMSLEAGLLPAAWTKHVVARTRARARWSCCCANCSVQLDFRLADPSFLTFNISTADCLALRQEAYNLLTIPSNILSGCLAPFMAPFMGNTTPDAEVGTQRLETPPEVRRKSGAGP